MKYRMGAVIVEFACDREEIRDHISYLLRYHKTDAEAATCTVRFQLDEALERNRCEQGGDGAYLCRYASNFLENATQRFYYRVLFPVLQKVCYDHAQMMVHCSLLGLDDGNSILVMGPSGGGKSTCAAAWLNYGMPLMGDDTIYITKGRCFPLKRELHIGEDSLSKFKKLKEASNLEPYMPGYKKLGYDWINVYPELVLEVAPLPKLIVVTAVCQASRTSSRVLTNPQQKKAFFQGNALSYTHSSFEHAWREICHIPFVEIVWGSDIWAYPQMHVGYIKNLLFQNAYGK